eukprot:5362648-Pyramimonas_sp.AAC.1
MEFWDLEDHEVCNCLLKTVSAGSPRHPPRPPCGVKMLETYQSSLLVSVGLCILTVYDYGCTAAV